MSAAAARSASMLADGPLAAAVRAARPERIGSVSAVVGLTLDIVGVEGAIGDFVRIGDEGAFEAEIVASTTRGIRCMPHGSTRGVRVGTPVRALGAIGRVPVGPGLLGRVLDGRGHPIDGRGPLPVERWAPTHATAPSALDRARIARPLPLGVRALDTLTTIGAGQRVGFFAGSGVGKSTLLSMIARSSAAEASVIALVGERGREVREFIEDDLGPEGLARSVVVVATADEPPLLRLRAALTATAIAESFRAAGADAVLMMDSLTRVAMAQREIGLSAGEPPATRGYPPSTFTVLAQLLERAGTDERGSVTGLYTVLVDGDDHNEPIADAARSLLDGHIVLDRRLALDGHYPPIDALASVSRVAAKIVPADRRAAATTLRSALAARRRVQDLLDVGAYAPGSAPLADAAIALETEIAEFLRQDAYEATPAEEAWMRLEALAAEITARSGER